MKKFKDMNKAESVGFAIGVLVVYAIFSAILAFLLDFAFQKFNADWSNFSGWFVLVLITPILRIWMTGRGN